MLKTFTIGAILSLGLSSAAFANCNCYTPNGGAYNVSQERGVTVMRGNMPNIRNPENELISQRKAAEKRAKMAERRARIESRRADKALEALASRPTVIIQNSDYRRRRSSPYFSGRYGYGASISRPARFGRRGFGGRNKVKGRGISRPVFNRRIRG
jgi:hypothetical protein